MNKKILVTGGSGYISTFVIIELINKGYFVKTTLRNLSKVNDVSKNLINGGLSAGDISKIEFVQGDLSDKKSVEDSVVGVDEIVHVASPTPLKRPDSDEEMVNIAINGVRYIMDAAHQQGIKHVVLTSASGAVLAGHQKNHPNFNENDWTNLNAPIDVYQRSKTRAEQVFWELAKKYNIDGSTVLPVAVMGPVLGKTYSHSNTIIKNMFEGKMPVLLNLAFDYVDVRDVAKLHVLALESKKAIGQRYIATSSDNISYKEVANTLIEAFPDKSKKISTRVMPNFVVKFLSNFRKDLKMPASFLGQNTAATNNKAISELGWSTISGKQAIIATAKSMIDLKIIDA